jgi:hypothetical protein
MAMAGTSPAQAACVVGATSVTCATTTTTDTTNAGGTPASDRNYPVDTSAGNFTGTISTGAVVDGFGLAFTNTVGGANTLNVVNDGSVTVSAGNAPAAGGIAALNVTAIGATNINYSGAGSIANLGSGAFADALVLGSTGTGNITANVGGNVTANSAGAFGIAAFHSGTAGNIGITTATGTTIRSAGMALPARFQMPPALVRWTITNGASILSPTGAPNTLINGITAQNFGLGALSISNTGAIGSATDRAIGNGINASINNATSAAALSVTGSGAIFSSGFRHRRRQLWYGNDDGQLIPAPSTRPRQSASPQVERPARCRSPAARSRRAASASRLRQRLATRRSRSAAMSPAPPMA